MYYCNDPGFHYWFLFPVGFGLFFFVMLLVWRPWYWRREHRQGYWRSDYGRQPIDPMEIARKRYAAGRITKEEFEQIRTDLKQKQDQK